MPKIKVLITGASGMLGTALVDLLSHNFDIYATSRKIGYQHPSITWKALDLFDRYGLEKYLIEIKPDVVIHCAALVNVDACEKNISIAEWLHIGVLEIITRAIRDWDGKLVYISTDAIFDGHKNGAYTEEDLPNPRNAYSRTKYDGELLSLSYENSIVLRTNIFGWSYGSKRTFAEWILQGLLRKEKLKMFVDVQFTPANVYFVAKAISKILDTKNLRGVYHATGEQILSKYDFAKITASVFNLDDDSICLSSIEDSNLTAVRSKNMALSNKRLCQAINYIIPGAHEGLRLMKSQYKLGIFDEALL